MSGFNKGQCSTPWAARQGREALGAEALHPVPAPPSLVHLLWSAVMEGSGFSLSPDVELRVKE